MIDDSLVFSVALFDAVYDTLDMVQ